MRAGFSIPEFIFVILISSILMSLAVMQLNSWKERNILNSTATEVRLQMEKAINAAGWGHGEQRIQSFQFNQQVDILIKSKDGDLVVYSGEVCSPARIILNYKREKCFLSLSLRCRIKNYCQ